MHFFLSTYFFKKMRQTIVCLVTSLTKTVTSGGDASPIGGPVEKGSPAFLPQRENAGELPPTSGIQAINIRLAPGVALNRWMLPVRSYHQSVVLNCHAVAKPST